MGTGTGRESLDWVWAQGSFDVRARPWGMSGRYAFGSRRLSAPLRCEPVDLNVQAPGFSMSGGPVEGFGKHPSRQRGFPDVMDWLL